MRSPLALTAHSDCSACNGTGMSSLDVVVYDDGYRGSPSYRTITTLCAWVRPVDADPSPATTNLTRRS